VRKRIISIAMVELYKALTDKGLVTNASSTSSATVLVMLTDLRILPTIIPVSRIRQRLKEEFEVNDEA
jgi:hypothetical protein